MGQGLVLNQKPDAKTIRSPQCVVHFVTMNPTYPYTHPEIEFRHAELVKNGPIIDSDGSDTFVDLLEIYPDRTEWKPNLHHSSLVDFIPVSIKPPIPLL